MDLYFGKINSDGKIILEDDEFRHLKVVRKNIGDRIQITDGEGNLFTAVLLEANKHNFTATIEETTAIKNSGPFLHLAISPTKNIDRIEWLVEKCVELGISQFSFIQCRHSERKDIKVDRLRRIAISAIKQSVKFQLPNFSEMIPFNTFISSVKEDQKFICTMHAEVKNHLKNILSDSKDALIMIGPEGDYHEDELKLALENKFINTSLGPERLRTETAALAACAYFNFNKHRV